MNIQQIKMNGATYEFRFDYACLRKAQHNVERKRSLGKVVTELDAQHDMYVLGLNKGAEVAGKVPTMTADKLDGILGEDPDALFYLAKALEADVKIYTDRMDGQEPNQPQEEEEEGN